MTNVYIAQAAHYYHYYANAEWSRGSPLHSTSAIRDIAMAASTDLRYEPSSRRGAATHDPATIEGGSPAARYYMSGDLRAATGISRTHLDFYLREGIVEPTVRSESGYLLFDDAERERLDAVMAWRRDGISLREIQRRLGRDREPDRAAGGSDDT